MGTALGGSVKTGGRSRGNTASTTCSFESGSRSRFQTGCSFDEGEFKTGVGLGYGFINFVSTEEAERFMQHFNGFSKWSIKSSKICEVSWSDALQGLEENVERYRNLHVMHPSVPD